MEERRKKKECTTKRDGGGREHCHELGGNEKGAISVVDIAQVKHVVDTANLKDVAPLAKAAQRGGQSDKLARERERGKERKRKGRKTGR